MYNRKKIIFPSIIAMCVACPVLAIDIDTLGKIDGENAMCNVNSALENDTGARFIARWTPNTYTCNPGTFLDHLTATCVTCTANYICPGGTHTFSESSDIGITSCESAVGNKYPYSDAGNSDSGMCYKSGTDSCSKINPVDNGTPTYATSGSSIPFRMYALNEGYYATNTIGACAITALTCDTGYVLNPTTNGPLANYIGQGSKISKANTKWRALDGSTDGSSKTSDGFGNSTGMTNGTVAYAWNNGTKIHFRASCNSTPAGSEFPYSTFNSSSTGVNCWCNMDSYTISGSTTSVTDTKWVFASKFDNSSSCASKCTSACYSKFHTKTEFEQTLFGTYGQQMACEPDYINCAPGYYLPANATQCVICTTGNYCAGGQFMYDATNANGIKACISPYTNSAVGASGVEDCYNTTTESCTSVNPYSVSNGTVSYANASATIINYQNGDKQISPLNACAITLSCNTGYSSTTPGPLANYIIPNVPTSSLAYIEISGAGQQGTTTGLSNGGYRLTWSDNTSIHGSASCALNADGTKYDCICSFDSYSLLGGTTVTVSPAKTYKLEDFTSVSDQQYCLDKCADQCAVGQIASKYTVRTSLFGDLGAYPICEPASYTCEPGTYLPAGATQCVACTTGNYCPGGTFTYSANAQGINACPATHASSAAGASSQNMCYVQQTRECATANPYNGGHGTATYNNQSASGKQYHDATFIFDTLGACAISSLSCDTGYVSTSAGALVNYALQNIIFDDASHVRYRALSGDTGTNQNDTGLAAGEWRVAWSDNTYIHGYASCNTTHTDQTSLQTLQGQFTNNEITRYQFHEALWGQNGISTSGASTMNTSSTGTSCWCQIDSYGLQGGTAQSFATPLWREVTADEQTASAEVCANGCAAYCAMKASNNMNYRMLSMYPLGDNPYCAVDDSITLRWYNQATLVETNSCTIGDAITFPSGTYTRTGYHATGWKLRTQQQSNVPTEPEEP